MSSQFLSSFSLEPSLGVEILHQTKVQKYNPNNQEQESDALVEAKRFFQIRLSLAILSSTIPEAVKG